LLIATSAKKRFGNGYAGIGQPFPDPALQD